MCIDLILSCLAVSIKQILNNLLVLLNSQSETYTLSFLNIIYTDQLYEIILACHKFLRKADFPTGLDQSLT